MTWQPFKRRKTTEDAQGLAEAREHLGRAKRMEKETDSMVQRHRAARRENHFGPSIERALRGRGHA